MNSISKSSTDDSFIHQRLSIPSSTALYFITNLMLLLLWGFFFLDYENNIKILINYSYFFNNLSTNIFSFVIFGVLCSFFVCHYSVYLLRNKFYIFISFLIFSFSISDAKIPVLHFVILPCRYFMMFVLVCYGILTLCACFKFKWMLHQKCGLFILMYSVVHLFLTSFNVESFLLMPVQLAIFIGVFFGMENIAKNEKELLAICYGIAIVGVLLTIINLLGFAFSPSPFQAGRYKSWYLLATGFANNYVLFTIPMFWLLIVSRNYFLKTILIVCLLSGVYMLILSGSRNALLSLIISFLIISIGLKSRYFIFIILVAFISFLLLYTFEFEMYNFNEVGSRLGKISDKETRFGVWQLAWKYIQNNFWLGHGLYVDLRSLSGSLPVWEQFNAHNAYLGIWLRLGVMGLLFYLVIICLSLWRGFVMLLTPMNILKNINIVYFTIFVAIFATGMFEENLSGRGSVQQILWGICASSIMIISHGKHAKINK